MRLRALAAVLLVAAATTGRAQDGQDAAESALHQAFDTTYANQLPPLQAKLWSTFAPTSGVLADRVTFQTTAGMLVPAIVYRPDPRTTHMHGKLPGIVIVNGHGSDKFGWYAFYSGVVFAKAGAVVLTYDAIGEGERNAQRLSAQSPSPHDVVPAGVDPDDYGQRLAGLMQTDLMQAIRYLDAQPEVDRKRVGVLGYSLGAFVAGIASAMDYYDHRIAAVILSGGGTYDNDPGYFDKNRNPCQGPPYRALLPALGSKRGEWIFALSAGKPMLVMNGADDTVMDIPHHDAAWFAAMKASTAKDFHLAPDQLFTSIMYPGVSHRPSWLNRDGVEWLNTQLHFPFWNTNAIIEAQGTTHIGTWAAAGHVFIPRNYTREDREGGIDAVGRDVPALTRAQLTVLPDADWLRSKDRLTLEAWVNKTRIAASAEAAKPQVH